MGLGIRFYKLTMKSIAFLVLGVFTVTKGMEHQEFLDFVAKYGELHHDGDVWRAYAYFTAQDGDQQCQPQRPNDPAKIFVDSVPDVWPAADSVPVGTTICNCFAAPSTTPDVLPTFKWEPICRTVKQTVDWDP